MTNSKVDKLETQLAVSSDSSQKSDGICMKLGERQTSCCVTLPLPALLRRLDFRESRSCLRGRAEDVALDSRPCPTMVVSSSIETFLCSDVVLLSDLLVVNSSDE